MWRQKLQHLHIAIEESQTPHARVTASARLLIAKWVHYVDHYSRRVADSMGVSIRWHSHFVPLHSAAKSQCSYQLEDQRLIFSNQQCFMRIVYLSGGSGWACGWLVTDVLSPMVPVFWAPACWIPWAPKEGRELGLLEPMPPKPWELEEAAEVGAGVLLLLLVVDVLVAVEVFWGPAEVLLELAGCDDVEEEEDDEDEGFRWESKELSKDWAARYGAKGKEIQILQIVCASCSHSQATRQQLTMHLVVRGPDVYAKQN